MKRRLLAVFMALALLVGLMPMSALAAPGGDYNTRIELEGANYIGFDSGDTATVTINGQTYEETIRRDSGNYYVYLYISSNRNSVDGTIEVNGYTADVTVSMRYMSSYRYTGTVDWYDWQQPTDYDVYIYFGGNTGVERNDYVSVSVNGSESEIYQVERSSGRLRVHISDAVVGADREDVTATVTFGGQTATIGLSFEDNYYSDYYTGTVNGWNGGSDHGEDGTYDAYYYLRYPGEDEDSRDVSLFTYVGKGSVDSDIGAPNSWSNQGRTVAITPNNENWMTLPEPDTQETHTGGTMDGHGSYEVSHNTYPEITYEDETYYYAESDEGIANPEHTYTIDWYRYSSSTGYNIGNVSFGTNGYEGYTWHVDGYINFSDKYTVTYKVQFPEDSSYSDVKYDEGSGAWVESDEGPYVVYVDDTDNVTVGSIDNAPEMRKTVEESGTTYEFQGWYYDSACIDEVESGDVITEDTILYGKYVEDEPEDEFNGTEVTVQVYLDGNLVESNPLNYVELSRNTNDTTRDLWQTSVVGSTITCDFNINPSEEHQYDCVDIDVLAKPGYILESVEYYQTNGSGNPQDVAESTLKEGAYRVDNVKHRTDGVQPDVKIYLSSEYTIEYYVNTAIDNNLSSTTDIYVAYREDANGRTNDSATATSDSTRFWTNPDTDIKTSVTLPEYSEAGMSFDGWYLGSMSNGDPISAGTTQNVTDEADAEDGETNHIIKYYGETQTTTGTLTVTKTVSGLDSGAVLNTETFEIYVTAQGASDPAYTLTIGQTGAENITYSVDDNGVHTWTISNVPLGEYSVTETGTEVSGYTLNTSASTTTGNAKLDADNLMPTVDLINSYTKNTYGLSVTKSVEDSEGNEVTGIVADGTALTYTVTVKNDSNVALTGVVVTDTLWEAGTVISVDGTVKDPLTGNSYTIASIAADASVTITYEYTVNDNASHQISNTAEASVTVEGEKYSDDATATVTVGYTDVSVTKELTSVTRGETTITQGLNSFVAQVGDVLNYTVTITNNGNTAATGSVTDELTVNGQAATLENINVTGGTADVTSSPWTFSGLAANGTVTITVSYTVKEGDKTITNSVTLGDGDDPDETVETSVAALSVTKEASSTTVSANGTITYTITVANTGNVDLTGVVVTDSKWASGMTITVGGQNITLTGTSHTIDSLDVNESVTITYSYAPTDADVTAEKVENTATASVTDGPSDSATATVTVTPQYVLTVNSYYESTSGTLFDTDTYTLDAGANWSVVIRPETDGTHVAPATVTDDDGNNYVFDEDLSDDDLTGTIGREDVTVNLVYSLDNWKDDETDDSETGGDGEPDYKQALIKYVVAEGQDSYGDVTPAIQVETLTDEDEDGTYTGNVTASSIATANEDYAFDYWTDPDGETSWNAELSDNFTATGGGEYTYTAYFDTDTNNDDIPDKYQVFVNFKSADENGSVRGNTFQVFTLRDENGNPTQSGNITPAEVTTVANENYQFDIWTEGTGETSVDPFAERQVEGGDTITFYAHFKGTNSVYTLDKALSAVDGATVPENYKAQVGDVLTYTITVTNEGNTVLENIILTDTFNGAGELDFGTIAEDAGYSVTPGEDGTATITITSLEVGESIAIVYTYTVVADDIGDVTDDEITILTNTVSSDTDGDDTPDITDEVEVNMDTYTVEIAPANIVVYTGGDPYGGITNEEGDLVVEEDDIEANGLPEPGYHIELSQAVMDWLNIEIGEEGARDLTGYLSFQYQDDVYQREWKLEYMGVYSTDPMRYVYSMYPTDPSNPEVRVVYTDAAGIEHFDDDITMDENTVYADYTMRIYGGELEQHDIVAVLTVNDESILAGVDIGEGTLTIRSTTNYEYVNDLGTGTDDVSANDGITAVHDENNTYYVNDTQVEIDTERVQLLVDEVSNSASFNAEMGDDAISHIENRLDVNLRDADYELKYMDLVDNANGNTVINMDGSLTIYWPVPDDAEGDEFYVVHYTDMDRSSISDASDLAGANKEIIDDVDVVRINGQEYVTFTTASFSPFALVYETDDGRRPNVPDPDDEEEVDEPDRDYEPKWLNTEDHFAYIVGYEDGEVKPNNNITRAEVATIFFRLLTDEARADFWSQENDYSDVSATDWFNNAVSTLSNAGIIDGYEDGTFRPNAPITRAEFTAIATRFFDYTAEYEGAFNDVSYSSWYADYVQAAVDMGLVDGYEDGGFHPDSYITRAEAVTIVNRVLGRVPHEDHLLDEDEMNVWPDNLYGAWYYADMQEATNSHDYDWIRVDSETVERWTDKLTERDWEALEQEWSSAYSG